MGEAENNLVQAYSGGDGILAEPEQVKRRRHTLTA